MKRFPIVRLTRARVMTINGNIVHQASPFTRSWGRNSFGGGKDFSPPQINIALSRKKPCYRKQA
jgi:hypothetical protein